VQTLSKSVYNCQSYWQKVRGTFLWPTVYFRYEEKYRKWMERLVISVTQWGEVEEGNWRGWSWWVRRWSTGQRTGWVQLLTLWMFVRLLYHLFDFLCRQMERPFDITYDTIGQKSLTWTSYTLQQHSCTSYVHVFGSNKGTFFGFINTASIIAFVYFQVAGKNQLSFVGNQWIHPYSTGFYGYIHGYPRKICGYGYGYGYGWEISYPWQPCTSVRYSR